MKNLGQVWYPGTYRYRAPVGNVTQVHVVVGTCSGVRVPYMYMYHVCTCSTYVYECTHIHHYIHVMYDMYVLCIIYV